MRPSASQKGSKSNIRRRNLVYSRNPLLACFVGESVLSSRGMHLSMNCDSAVASQRTFFSLIPVDRSQVNDSTGEPSSPQLTCIGQVKHRHVKAASTVADVVTEDLTRMDINDGVIPHSVPVSRSPPRGQYQKHDNIMKLRKGESLWSQKEDSFRHQFESSFKLQRVETFQLRREESFKVQKEQSFKLQKEESYRLLKGLNFKLQAKEQPAVKVPTIDDIPHLDLSGGNGLGLSKEETFSDPSGNALTNISKDEKNGVAENVLNVTEGNGLNVEGENGLDVAGKTVPGDVDGKTFRVGGENALSASEESAGRFKCSAVWDVPDGAGRNDLGVSGEKSLHGLFGNASDVASEDLFNAHRKHIWGVKSSGHTAREDFFDKVASPRMKSAARLTRCSRRVVDDDNRLDDDDKINSPSHRNSIRYLNHFLRHKLGASMVRSVLVCGWSSGEVSPPMSPKSDRSDSHSDSCEIDLSRFAAGEFQPKTPSFKDTRCGHHAALHRKLSDIRISSQQRSEDPRWYGDRTWPEDQGLWKDESGGKEQNDLCEHQSPGEVGRCSPAGFILQPVTEAALWKRRCTPRSLS